MDCKTYVSGRDQKAERKQYPDYITYLKNREADRFFNMAMVEAKKEAAADRVSDADAESTARDNKKKHLKNAIRLNPYDIEAKAELNEACPKGERDIDASGGFVNSIQGIKIFC